jgi:hypothetical protein
VRASLGEESESGDDEKRASDAPALRNTAAV